MADIRAPSRQQLAKMAGNDPELLRALESLFDKVGVTTPDQIEVIAAALQDAVIDAAALSARIAVDTPLPDDLTPPTVPPHRARYGVFHDTTTQTAAVVNTAYPMAFGSVDASMGVYIVDGSKITVDTEGAYNFQFSAQLDKTSGGVGFVFIWAAINGVSMPESAGKIRIQGNDAEAVAAWNYVYHMAAGDYFQLMWSVDTTDIQIQAFPASPPVPLIPSVIMTVTDNIAR